MLQQFFGTQLDFPVRVAVALIVIAVLLGVTIMLLRRFSGVRAVTSRNRSGPRLSLVDSISIDQRRKLMLVRCDEVEHLLLVGGSNDVVVDADVGRIAAAEAQAPRMSEAALREIAAREAATLVREPPPARLAANVAAALPPQAETPRRPPQAQPELSAPPEPEALSAPAPAPEAKRPSLSRRPLLRGDGTVSGRPAANPAPARTLPGRAAPAAPALPRGAAPAPEDAERADAVRPAPAALTAPEAAPVTPPAAPAVPTPPAAPVVPAAAEPPAPRREAARASEPSIDEMAERLDLALSEAEDAPRISLEDLLDDDLTGGATPAEAAEAPAEEPEETPEPAHAMRPVLKPAEPAPPVEAAPAERPRPALVEAGGRDLGAADRSIPRERPRDARPAPLPQPERPSRFAPPPRRDAPVRPEVRPGAPDTSMRPREFAFRAPEGQVRPVREPPRVEMGRRSAPELENRAPAPLVREGAAGESAARAPEISVRDLPKDLPKRDGEPRRGPEAPPRSEPLLSARRWEPASGQTESPARPGAIPPVAPPADPFLDPDPATAADPAPADDIDPLGDLDAEMASLLGRTTASGH